MPSLPAALLWTKTLWAEGDSSERTSEVLQFSRADRRTYGFDLRNMGRKENKSQKRVNCLLGAIVACGRHGGIG